MFVFVDKVKKPCYNRTREAPWAPEMTLRRHSRLKGTDMKQRKMTILPPAGSLSLICCGLRILQNLSGFEPETGLPVSGSIPAVLLPVVLVASAAALLALAWRTLPKKAAGTLREQFDLSQNGNLTMVMVGAGIMVFSGAWEMTEALGLRDTAVLSADGMELIARSVGAERTAAIMGALSVAAGVCLLIGAVFCRRAEEQASLPLLAVPVCLLIRMIFVYRVHSVNPVLADYYLEILGLAVLILAFYRLSGFAVQAGNPALFGAYTGMAVVLTLPMMADGSAAAVLNLGGTIALLGFDRMRRSGSEEQNISGE